MKRKLRYALIFSALTIITAKTASAQVMAAITAHFNAVNNHNIESIAAGYAPNAQVFSPNWEGARTGTDSISNVYKRYFKSTPDLAYVLDHSISDGNVVLVEYTFSGTLSNPEPGTPDYMKGKKYTLQGCAVFVVKDNKIIKETNYFDQVAFLRQVGFFDQNH